MPVSKIGYGYMDYDYWRQLIEEYLKDPFLSTKNMDLE
jgi:hypothetical protein